MLPQTANVHSLGGYAGIVKKSEAYKKVRDEKYD